MNRYSVRGKSHFGVFVIFCIFMVCLIALGLYIDIQRLNNNHIAQINDKINEYGLDASGLSDEEKSKLVSDYEQQIHETEEEHKAELTEQGLTKIFKINSIDEFPQDVIDKALSYTDDVMDSNVYNHDDLYHILANGCSSSPEYKERNLNYDFERYETQTDGYHLDDIVLFVPKDGATPILKFIYGIDGSVYVDDPVWGGDPYGFIGTVYVELHYEVDLNNDEMPIADYNGYESNETYDIDFENFYNKEVVSYKDKYVISEHNISR